MRFSSFVERIGGEGAAAWEIHGRGARLKRQGKDVILLSVGDPDFDTPPAITDAAIESLRRGRTHYGEVVGDHRLRAAIAAAHQAQSGQPTDPDQVVVMAGAQCALYAAAVCVLDQGDEIIVPEPAYVTYEAVVGASGARMAFVPLKPERGFQIDPESIERAVTPRTRALLLNSPNNPTGAVITRANWERIAAICIRHDLWLLSDEVYAGLTYESQHVSPAGLPGMAERTVTINSLSKSHAMTGWRLGWSISPPALAEHLGNLALCMLYGSPPFIQDAALQALTAEPPEVKAMKEGYRRRRDLVCGRLGNVKGLRCHRPEGGMFAMVDVRGTGLGAYDFASGLLDAEGVSVLPGDAFGPSAAGHVRISLGNADEELARACDRIERYAAKLAP
ncbi:arginine--pyruvate transaminase AruH [Hypericibacter adhaerens]|uniref:Aminotransferase n=1 Tax=Hypericibacter adhaerens TaxID=2602016 RepID=A0A5J6MWA8_9PROT|nr:pyridoxal phosphate-dependent aminotransferase [Hypericibacter adhaerens]QEX21749.1 arginine--pyruvate transaminase AruH [Hypericibacter adhaerens]